MLSVVHLHPPTPGEDLRPLARAALEVLARRPGFVRGRVGRATDDADSWVLLTEWESVGAYRRGLGNAEVKTVATPLFHLASGAPSAFEDLVSAEAGVVVDAGSDLATSPVVRG